VKKTFSISVLVIAFLLAGSAFAQKVTYLEIGSFNAKATDPGIFLSFGSGKEFDERVELGVSLDLFVSDHTDEESVFIENPLDPYGPPIEQVVTNFESSVTMIPLMGNVLVRFPIEFPVIPYAGGGIGYTLLWYKFDNYDTGDSDTQAFGGFTYRLQAGAMYPLGSRSAFLAEIFMNGAKPSHKEETDIGKPTRSEIDMSGLGIRIGFRLGGFGFF